MSAIAGILQRDGAPVPAGLLAMQAEALRHRGPALVGPFAERNFGASVRLHPGIPAHDRAPQPAAARNGRYRLMVSGIVYNRAELAETLAPEAACPHPPASADVLLHAFLRWGPEGLARCNGAFACAIWDDVDQQIGRAHV